MAFITVLLNPAIANNNCSVFQKGFKNVICVKTYNKMGELLYLIKVSHSPKDKQQYVYSELFFWQLIFICHGKYATDGGIPKIKI